MDNVHATVGHRRSRSPWTLISLMANARRHRLALAKLDGRLLDDVGLDADAARAEASRPLWDVPATWLR